MSVDGEGDSRSAPHHALTPRISAPERCSVPHGDTRAWNGEFGGSVQSTTGCLQTGTNQILAQGLTENDNWFASGGDDRIGSSALTGTVSTLPREDGSRLYEWTGTVTGGTWFRGHR